jgi:hypothetical protein
MVNNPLNNKRRRLPTWQTSRNTRLFALDATDVMVLQAIQARIRVGLSCQVMASHMLFNSLILQQLVPNQDVGIVIVHLFCSWL